MMGRTHMVAGAASWVLVSSVAHMKFTVLGIPVAIVASLLPDVDHPTSILGKKIYPVSAIIGGIFGHRGITHSLIAVLALIGVMAYFNASPLIWAASVGYLSHLLGDWLTPSGVPLLYPNMKKFSSPYPIQTGGLAEFFIMGMMVFAMLAYFFG